MIEGFMVHLSFKYEFIVPSEYILGIKMYIKYNEDI